MFNIIYSVLIPLSCLTHGSHFIISDQIIQFSRLRFSEISFCYLSNVVFNFVSHILFLCGTLSIWFWLAFFASLAFHHVFPNLAGLQLASSPGHALSSTLSLLKFQWVLMRILARLTGIMQSALINSDATLVIVWHGLTGAWELRRNSSDSYANSSMWTLINCYQGSEGVSYSKPFALHCYFSFPIYSRFHETLTTNFVGKFASSLRSSKVHNEIHKPVCKLRNWLASLTSGTNQGLCSQIGLWIPIWTCELRNEVRTICGQSFVKSTARNCKLVLSVFFLTRG